MTTYEQEMATKIKNMEAELASMKHLLEQAKTSQHYWQPANDEQFYYIDPTGNSKSSHYNKYITTDPMRYRIFRTKEEAEEYAKYVKAEGILKKAISIANEGWKPEWSLCTKQLKFYIFKDYFYKNSPLTITEVYTSKSHSNFMYMKSKEVAYYILVNYKEELETYLAY